MAIIKFLAAAELVESDFWQQYNELGGVNGGNPAYKLALQNLDGDMPQYISDNTDDEMSHAAFLNAYLMSKGEHPVNLDAFRTLPRAPAHGRQTDREAHKSNESRCGHQLVHPLSQYAESGSRRGTFPQAVEIRNQPAIPVDDARHSARPSISPYLRRITGSAACKRSPTQPDFILRLFDSAGSSVYTNLILNVSDPEVLRVLVSILGVEVNHFAVWHDKAGNAVAQPLAGVTEPENGCDVPGPQLPAIRRRTIPNQSDLSGTLRVHKLRTFRPAPSFDPLRKQNAGAVTTATAIVNSQLFLGQPQAFFDAVSALAKAADAARREPSDDD